MWLTLLALLIDPVTAEPVTALYVIENLVGPAGVVDERQLIRIRWTAAGALDKQVIVKKPQSFFAHFGAAHFIGDRWLASPAGSVLDRRTGQVLHEVPSGQLLAVDDHSATYRLELGGRRPEILRFDVNTSKIAPPPDIQRWTLPGAVALDVKKSVRSNRTGQMELHHADGTHKIIGTGFRIDYSPFSSRVGDSVPALWLDNEQFVTQKRNGEIVVMTVAGATTPIATIPDAPQVVAPPTLYRDPSRRIIYVCERRWEIDVAQRLARELQEVDVGHHFTISVAADEMGRHVVQHRGKIIGVVAGNSWGARTAPNFIAIPVTEPAAPRTSANAIAIWYADANRWQTIRLWPYGIVGWGK